MCSYEPQPPAATTGIEIALETDRISSRSYPCIMPSRSTLVSRISPAPRSSTSPAHPTTLSERIPTPDPASMDTTMAWLPNFFAASVIKSGRANALELMETLSAPQASSRLMSLTLRTPPPIVTGQNRLSHSLLTSSNRGANRDTSMIISSSTSRRSMTRRRSWIEPMRRSLLNCRPLTAPCSSQRMTGMTRVARPNQPPSSS